jgi:HEAT repeat protein
MDLAAFLSDKRLTAKQRSSELARQLLDRELKADDLTQFATTAKDTLKSVCLEALELATRTAPALATEAVFELAAQALADKAPAVKREAGRLVSNIAERFPKRLDQAIKNLVANTAHEGDVVRWSAALALGEIIKMRTPHNRTLVPKAEALIEREEKDSIRKIYKAALKAAQK